MSLLELGVKKLLNPCRFILFSALKRESLSLSLKRDNSAEIRCVLRVELDFGRNIRFFFRCDVVVFGV